MSGCTANWQTTPNFQCETHDSLAHHRYGEFRIDSRIPNASGRYCVHLAVSLGAFGSSLLMVHVIYLRQRGTFIALRFLLGCLEEVLEHVVGVPCG